MLLAPLGAKIKWAVKCFSLESPSRNSSRRKSSTAAIEGFEAPYWNTRRPAGRLPTDLKLMLRLVFENQLALSSSSGFGAFSGFCLFRIDFSTVAASTFASPGFSPAIF